MLIWIVTTGEQIPFIDGNNVRLWRSVMLTNELVKQGHHIVRWSSTFDHTEKRHRFDTDKEVVVNEQYKILFLKTPGYKRNISLKRIQDHQLLADKFEKEARQQPKPALILCSLPTIELCVKATDYGKRNAVPVVLDGRDMWPDLFEDFFPKPLRFLTKLILRKMYQAVTHACRQAYALSGISEPYITWEANYAGRQVTQKDKWFPHGYPAKKPSEQEQAIAFDFWKQRNIGSNDSFIVCLFTAMGHVVDIDSVIIAARILNQQNLPIQFVLCGQGDKLELFKEKAKGCKNIVFPGWVGFSEIWTLMRLSKIGILPYFDIDNYKFNVPNKPIEYLSAALPILSGVKGLIEKIIIENNCGLVYQNGEVLATHLKDLYYNPTKLKQLSEQAYKLYQERFIAEKVYADMATYLVDLALKFNENE